MEQQEMISRIHEPLQYLGERKEVLFNKIALTKQKLENLNGEMEEQKAYLELETKKEQQESNIFRLYDTDNPHGEEKQRLSGSLERLQAEKSRFEKLLHTQQAEFEQVKQGIVSSQIVIKELEEREILDAAGGRQPSVGGPADIINSLKLCLELFDLDRERCRLELKRMLEEAEKREAE